jgi:prepilin-type N-terminal cleavage/methylation domain-containing protein
MSVISPRTSRRCAGFTLTELAIVLGVIGVILGALWVAAAAVFTSSKADQAAQDITQIAANIRMTYLSANSFTANGDQTTNMINAGVIPKDLLNSAGTAAFDNWNGAVKITFSQGGNARLFRITFDQVPRDACFRIASQLANLGTADAPVNLVTGATATLIQITTSPPTVISETVINNLCAGNTAPFTFGFDYKIH